MKEIHGCRICKKEYQLCRISTHLHCKHSINLKNYYDTYFKKDDEGLCLVCGKETRFKSFKEGYFKYHVECVAKDKSVQQKKKDNFKAKTTEEQEKIKREARKKLRKTCKEKYGKEEYFSTDDFKNNLERKNDSISKFNCKNCLSGYKRYSEFMRHLHNSKNCLDLYLRLYNTTELFPESILNNIEKQKDLNFQFQCEFCKKKFPTKKSIGKHIQTKSKKICRELYYKKYEILDNFPWNRKVKCKNCNSLASQESKTELCKNCFLKMIVKDRKRNAKIITKNVNFLKNSLADWRCEFCNISFETLNDLNTHANSNNECSVKFYKKYRIQGIFSLE